MTMTPQRFEDRFRFYKREDHQLIAVNKLYNAIKALPGGETVLDDEAPWALAYSRQPLPPAPVAPPAAPRLMDPRGSEEKGLLGPKGGAPMRPGDHYLLINNRPASQGGKDCECFDHTGKMLWVVPAIAEGQAHWKVRRGDTPPGLYKLGAVYKDHENPANTSRADLMAYGWYSFAMDPLEGQLAPLGRDGIMIHGGGTSLGWPGAWATKQRLVPTNGCVRMHNADLRDRVLPLVSKGTVYVGVFQL